MIGGACKIRKRGCSSPSSTPSVLRKYRFKRAILVGKRGGSSTPIPTWKMNAGSLLSVAGISESSQYQPSHIGGKGMQVPVSARKLATALWEMNKIPPPQSIENQQHWRSKKEMRGRGRAVWSLQPGPLPCRVSDPSHSPDLESTSRSRTSSHRRIMPTIPQKFRYNEHNHRVSDYLSNGSLMETDAHSQGQTSTSFVVGMKCCLKDLNNGLMTSKELLKLLGRIWGLKEKHSSGISLVSALRVELDRACVQVDQLIQERRSDQNTINCLEQQFAEERSAWKSEEQERIRAAAHSLMEELESEKRSRSRAERLNKKLGVELAKMRTSLLKAVKELESERRSKKIIEQVFIELVRGIGEDKAEVEELKRESAKVQEELEKEREMLQIADEWREERVQMKLSEAKFQIEEKNAVVDHLRNELEAYLMTKRAKEPKCGHVDVAGKLEVEEQSPLVHPSKSCRANDLNVDEREEAGELEDGEEEDDGVVSADSDLHSIELNMDSNNKSYSWSYATAAAKDDTRLALVGEKKPGRITNCDQVPLDRGMYINKNFQHLGYEPDQGILSETSNLLEGQTCNLDQERYISVKGLRDRMLAASRIALARGLASRTRQWSRLQASQDMIDQVCQGSNITEMVKAAIGSVDQSGVW